MSKYFFVSWPHKLTQISSTASSQAHMHDFMAWTSVTQSCFVFFLRSDGFYWLGALSTRLALSNETALEYFTLVNMWTVRKQALGPNSARSAGLSSGSALTERLINERGKCHIQASGAKHFDLPHKSLRRIMRFPVTRVSVPRLAHALPNGLGIVLRYFVVFPNRSAHAGELCVMKMHKPARPWLLCCKTNNQMYFWENYAHFTLANYCLKGRTSWHYNPWIEKRFCHRIVLN